jgi:subtilisin family serine protease
MAKKPTRRRPGRRPSRRPGPALRRAAAASTDPVRTIVYVHGIGNKPVASILKCQWDDALFGFDLGARSRLAYWVSRDYYPEPSPGTCASGDLIALEDEPTGRSLTIAQHLREVSLSDEVDALTSDRRARQVLRGIAREVEGGAGQPDPKLAAQAVRGKILPLPAVLRRWITRKLTRALLRDVHDYFFVPARRTEMRDSLLERLEPGGGPFAVIGHSQGSMIAYDVLGSLDPARFDVRLFVTIGSPLGITEVQDQLKVLTHQTRLAVPACVGRWLNVADPLDPVAADTRLADDFTPRRNIVDERQWNRDSPRHPHSGTGYLRTMAVRTAVRDVVARDLFQPVAEFVVARDAVRALENGTPETRHPVLIELVHPTEGGDRTLDGTRDELVRLLGTISGEDEEALRIERLRRFVAADLTRREAETLSAHPLAAGVTMRRIWRNSVKRALLERSAHTVQATAAHAGYAALGREITWAVLDSGIRADHPHFERFANIERQFDCTKRGRIDDDAPDGNGHGTHVAGIIAGYREVTEGGSTRIFPGMAPEARLRIYKVLDDRGFGEDAWIIKALDHIAAANENAGRLVIHGVNLSLGGPFDQSVYGCGHSPLCEELRRLWQQGVLVVIAAGNEGFAVLQTLEGTIDANMDLSVGDPANLEEAIAVGSVHKESPHTYGVSYFSSRGPTADGRQKPDLVAPGERILSCRHAMRREGTTVGDLYVAMSGTSMAAPHVSGVLAAFLSRRREFIGYPRRVKDILLANCTDLGRDRPHQGAGLPNLVKMLVSA